MWRQKITSRMMKAVSVGFILMISQSAQAENLMEVYQKALMNDPQLLGVGYAYVAAGESVKEAKGRMLPLLGFEYSQGTTNQDITKSDSPFQPTGEGDFPTTDYSLTLTQPVFNWSLYAGYKQAKADTERADAEYASNRYEDLINSLGLKHALGTLSEADLEAANLGLQFVAKNDFDQGLQTKNNVSLIVRPSTGRLRE